MDPVLWYALAVAALTALLFVLVLYVVALIRRDNTIIDIAWGPGILLISLTTLWSSGAVVGRQLLVLILVAIWAVRLGSHIFLRNTGQPEDFRHAALRQSGGAHFWFLMFFRVFLLQGVLLIVLALPVIYLNATSGPGLSWRDWIGAALWAVGFLWEAISDYQLARFRHHAANAGRILQTGLWKYSRHPNYFGEALLWWGIWSIASSVPGAWMTVIGPLAITLILLRVSGIPALESRQRHNPEFREYARRTSAFIPWFSRS